MYDIQKIKELENELKNTSITSYMEEIGAEYQNGRWFCPFHDETNPSLSVNESEGIWHCFSCRRGGGYGKLVYEYMSMNDETIKLYYQALEIHLKSNRNLSDRLGFTSMKDGNYNRTMRDKSRVYEYVYGITGSEPLLETRVELREESLTNPEELIKKLYRLQYQL